MNKIARIIFILLVAVPCFAFENLDEIEARVDRRGVNTFYSGEDVGNSYIWQPQTLFYIDTTIGKEVVVLTSVDGVDCKTGLEYAHNPWSADGKRMVIEIDRATIAYAYSHGTYANDHSIFSMSSDGTNLRPLYDSPARIATHNGYTQWSPTLPDVYYTFGRSYAGESGFDKNGLYEVSVSDASVSNRLAVDVISGDTSTERDLPKQAITPDGLYALANTFAESSTIAILDISDGGLKLAEYAMDRDQEDTQWLNTPSDTSSWHDEMFVGNSSEGYWIYYLFSVEVGGAWWRMKPWGTDGGSPDFTVDDTDPYDWWEGTAAQREIQAVNGIDGNVPTHSVGYWSHGSPDRWGSNFVYSDTENVGGVGPGTANIEGESALWFGIHPTQYHAWTGWTDYISGACVDGSIYIAKYNDNSSFETVRTGHITAQAGQFTKPGQSPDGTKIIFRDNFLQTSTSLGDVFYVVAYYPFSPEIISCNATGGTVTTRFDWRTEGTSRGYTQRGWPDESTDDPPPPRETQKFRLWRSTDKSTWVPRGTVNAEIFTKYDFSDGTWDTVKYWDITDEPGDGTWYYAVTSLEWSGLESHALSNIFSVTVASGTGTGEQDTAYPAAPGADAEFYGSSIQADALTRYYNIYADDGSTPTMTQTMRIASISVNADRQYVDWLGNGDGSTQYVVTAVDYQGNESGAITPGVVTDTPAAGMYSLSWGPYGEVNRISFSDGGGSVGFSDGGGSVSFE